MRESDGPFGPGPSSLVRTTRTGDDDGQADPPGAYRPYGTRPSFRGGTVGFLIVLLVVAGLPLLAFLLLRDLGTDKDL